jgi:hypothetical protein
MKPAAPFHRLAHTAELVVADDGNRQCKCCARRDRQAGAQHARHIEVEDHQIGFGAARSPIGPRSRQRRFITENALSGRRQCILHHGMIVSHDKKRAPIPQCDSWSWAWLPCRRFPACSFLPSALFRRPSGQYIPARIGNAMTTGRPSHLGDFARGPLLRPEAAG